MLITAALVILFVWYAWELLLLIFAGLLLGIILRALLILSKRGLISARGCRCWWSFSPYAQRSG